MSRSLLRLLSAAVVAITVLLSVMRRTSSGSCVVEANMLSYTAATTFTSIGYHNGESNRGTGEKPCWGPTSTYYHDIRGAYAFEDGCTSNWERIRNDAGHLDPTKHCSIWFNGTDQVIPGPKWSSAENGMNHVAALTMWSPGGFVGAISQLGGKQDAKFYYEATDSCKPSLPDASNPGWISSSIDLIVTPRNPNITAQFLDGGNELCNYTHTGLTWNTPVLVSPMNSWVSRGSNQPGLADPQCKNSAGGNGTSSTPVKAISFSLGTDYIPCSLHFSEAVGHLLTAVVGTNGAQICANVDYTFLSANVTATFFNGCPPCPAYDSAPTPIPPTQPQTCFDKGMACAKVDKDPIECPSGCSCVSGVCQ